MNVQRLLEDLRRLPPWPRGGALRVAYSGGLDSTCLLHGLVALRAQLQRPLDALHVHHNLCAESSEWAEHCQAQAAAWGITCTVLRVNVHDEKSIAGAGDEQVNHGGGQEAQARTARYTALAAALASDDLLLSAHHGDDLLETILFRLLRGAGVRGLVGMTTARPLAAGWLCRPLLSCNRAALREYANAHNLQWCEDASNSDARFDRNYLRHHVVPALRRRWPQCTASAARTARNMEEAHGLLCEVAVQDVIACTVPSDGVLQYAPVLCVASLQRLTPPRLRNLLRYWLQAHESLPPSARLLHALCARLATPSASGAKRFDLTHTAVWHYNDKLYLDAYRDACFNEVRAWSCDMNIVDLPALGYQLLCTNKAPSSCLQSPRHRALGITRSALSTARCTLRPRRGGEVCIVAGHVHHRKLKKWLNEYRLPPWERQRLPLLYIGERLAAVPGVLVCDWCAATQDAKWLKPVARNVHATSEIETAKGRSVTS